MLYYTHSKECVEWGRSINGDAVDCKSAAYGTTGSIPVFPTKQCGCVAERLGAGLQILIMQVRFLSPTPLTIAGWNIGSSLVS